MTGSFKKILIKNQQVYFSSYGKLRLFNHSFLYSAHTNDATYFLNNEKSVTGS